MSLAPELEALRAEVKKINEDARALCAGLSEEELAQRPAAKRWSIAENFTHLATVVDVFLPALDAAIAEGRRANRTAGGPFRLGIMGRFYRWYVEPPPVIRLPAPKVLHPVLRGPAREALPRFLESQDRVAQRLANANGLDLTGVRMSSPIAKYIRMDLLTIFNVFTGHARRHLWQASRVRDALGQL